MKIIYLCDGKVEDCTKTGCGLIHEGGVCFHTTREDHAKNEPPRIFRSFDGDRDELILIEMEPGDRSWQERTQRLK